MKKLTTGVSAAFIMMAALPIQAQFPHTAHTTSTQQKSGQEKVLNNKVCPVSGEAVGSMGAAKVVEHKGYKISLCCKACAGKFNADPDAYLKKALSEVQAQQAAQQDAAVKPLNNALCPISGKAVGSMQAASHVDYKGYKIGLCCDSCNAQFNKDPDKYLQTMLNASKAPTSVPAQQ